MPNPLFSTYKAGENRVTSSTMAVFERIDLTLVQELLEVAGQTGDELRSVTFLNQVTGDASIPDARISARFTWWFETKVVRGGYAAEGHDREQVRSHARLMMGDPDARLFVLTPDATQPSWFDAPDGIDERLRPQVIWLSFLDLAAAIEAILQDTTRLIGERTRFLLTELAALYEAEGLLTTDDTVVVAAKAAWGEYLEYAAYVCQPERSFREDIAHFGFYFQGAIQRAIPRILGRYPTVTFTQASADAAEVAGQPALAALIRRMLNDGVRSEGDAHGVVLLSPVDDSRTITLSSRIINDLKTDTGRGWAWTLGQRYTRLDRLKSGISRTSQLSSPT